MSVPRLEQVAQRLQLCRHEAFIEDLLDTDSPRVRLTVRPWRGPWSEKLSPPTGVLELALEVERELEIVMRTWLDANDSQPTDESCVPSARLSAAWLDSQVLDFVAKLLRRA
jgi:hypothetical protein